ncbi:MAG: DUF6695 family protein, partial [Bacteroidota bacterium]|nr:DUF6695 family protein [Bacteroidota bacterium]
VGHAALVLVDNEKLKCHYFDFGRYHAPLHHARVRSAVSDNGLAINAIPVISENGDRIENFRDILKELQLNAECHGEGKLHASYCSINFQKAYARATSMQKNSPMPYGPFKRNGSNCSRFVNTSILAGMPDRKFSFSLKYLVPLTPTPLNNVNSLSNKIILPKMLSNIPFYPLKVSDKNFLKSTLPQPERHNGIPETAQWLSGEGAGSWFCIRQNSDKYLFSRFNENGLLECEGKFEENTNPVFIKDNPYRFVHQSNCSRIRIQQENRIIEFKRVG